MQSIPSEINDQLEKNKNADKKETQTKVAEKKSEDSDENVNWEKLRICTYSRRVEATCGKFSHKF